MLVTAWNNGAHNRNGSGYGFRVSLPDRDAFFKPEWESILLEIEGEPEPVEMPIDKDSFWGETCREQISIGIGKWLRKHGLAPWPRGNPPTFILEPLEEKRFRVQRARKKASTLR